MFLVSGLAAVLFLGGWHGPIPFGSWFGLTGDGLLGFLGNLLGAFNLLLKATIGTVVMIWVRWSLPRLRIDQVLDVCLKYCLPIACAMLAGAALWQAFLPGGLLPTWMQYGPAAERRFSDN
jgi:NADH-quinone oxidoreductase subunit H